MGQSQSTCSKVDSSFLDFCEIKTSSSCQSKKTWHLTSSDNASEPTAYFETLLEDYHLALTPTTPGDADLHSPVHTRPRVDAILHLLLAQAKRKVLGDLDPESEAADTLGTLFWGYEQSITVPGSWSDGNNVRECAVDYVLWYGDQTELKTNLVVLRAEKPIENCAEYLPTLAAIAMIQRNREDGLAKETYGIYTDGFKWIFMHVNRKYKYCSLELNWTDSRKAIIGQISKILDKAVSIRLSCGGPDWGATENWSVWNVKPRDISEEDAEWLEYDGKPLPEIKTFKSVKTSWIHSVAVRARLESTMKAFFDRYKLSTAAKAMIRELVDIARTRGHDKESDENDSGQPTTLALSDIRAQDVDCIFGLECGEQSKEEVWHLDDSEKRGVPKYLSQVLEDYKLAFGRARQNEPLIRARVNALMLAALAGKKREKYQHQRGKGPDNSPSYDSVRWGVENEISAPWLYKRQQRMIRGTMDHVLWYGRQKKMEGNTVVVVKGLNHSRIGRYEAMSYMAILKRLRRKAGCPTIPIYGIATDSYDWYFIRLCPLDTISYKRIGFIEGNEVEIVSHLHKFMDHAAGLTTASNSVSTSQHTGSEC